MGIKLISKRDYIARTQESANHGRFAYPHGCSKADHRRMQKEWGEFTIFNEKAAEKAAAEYEKKVAAGLVRSPSFTERWVSIANGHPDNQSVQAARRVCEKRGINWRTD